MLYGKGIYKKTLIFGGKNKEGEMFYTRYNSKDKYILTGNYKTIEEVKEAIEKLLVTM